MKQVIRRNVFETNSSSLHSISILDTDNEIKDLSSLSYDIGFGEYGQYWDKLTTPYEILCYLWTMCNIYTTDRNKKYRDLMLEWLPNCKFQKARKCKEVENGKVHYYYNIDGYIDHGGIYYMDYDLKWNAETHDYDEIPKKSMIEEIFESKEAFSNLVFNGLIIVTSDANDAMYQDDADFDNENATLRDLYTEEFIPNNAIKTWVKGS